MSIYLQLRTQIFTLMLLIFMVSMFLLQAILNGKLNGKR